MQKIGSNEEAEAERIVALQKGFEVTIEELVENNVKLHVAVDAGDCLSVSLYLSVPLCHSLPLSASLCLSVSVCLSSSLCLSHCLALPQRASVTMCDTLSDCSPL